MSIISPTHRSVAPSHPGGGRAVDRRVGFDARLLLRWVPTFLAFPLAGLAARAVVGPVSDLSAAAIGGAVAGTVIGVVQSLPRAVPVHQRWRWVAASALGLAAGLSLGAASVGYRTDAASLAVMGACSGLGLGAAQAAAMAGPASRRWVWAASMPALWALGWWITANVIVDADRQHANFGASGALVVTLLSGVVLAAAPDRRSS
jgi:hypothetical protein